MNGAIQLERKRGCSSSTTVLLCECDILFVHPANVLWSNDTFPTKKKLSEPFVERAIESVTYVIFRAGLRRSLRFCLGERTVIQVCQPSVD